MTLDDRIEIQECLNKGMTFKAIAQRIEKDQPTVPKEVKLRGKIHANGYTKIHCLCYSFHIRIYGNASCVCFVW